MSEIILESFPFDTMEILNEESGQMEDDRLYEAKIFRKYFKMFLSNGVYFGDYKNYKENSMKVILDGGMNIKVGAGAGIIEGADFENESEKVIALERPASGSRIDRIVVQFNTSLDIRNTVLIVKKGNGLEPAELERNENIYEICLAEVTVKSTSNLIAEDIKDTRINKDLCGIVNSLISVDGEELYNKFQKYIDNVSDEFVRKDQDVVIKSIVDEEGKILSTNDFSSEYKQKLDNIENSANKTVINNTLTSTSTTEALSANMGKKLNDEKQKKITYGTTTPTGGNNGDIYIQYF